MPRGYPNTSVRDSVSLILKEWRKLLKEMTEPCTIKTICMKTGKERHTVEAIRMKVLYALLKEQRKTGLKDPVRLYCREICTVRKGPKPKENQKDKEENDIRAVLLLENADGLCVGISASPSDVVDKETGEFLQEKALALFTNVMPSIHYSGNVQVAEEDKEFIAKWRGFWATFNGVSKKHLDAYIAWFCFLQNSEVIGKKRSAIVAEMYRILTKQERFISNRSFRKQ